MSFGFGVGDFITVGNLALRLYNACNDAPRELAQLRGDLSSLHILLSSLELQANDPKSLLHRECGDRRSDWLFMRDNLEDTLKELRKLVKKNRNMGKNTWQRVQLGLKDLSDLRVKLGLQLQAMHTLFGGLTLSSLGRLEDSQRRIKGSQKRMGMSQRQMQEQLGRMEEQLGKLEPVMRFVARLLPQSSLEDKTGYKTNKILSSYENSSGLEWDQLQRELIPGCVSQYDLEPSSERVKEILDWVVNNEPDLANLQEINAEDSISLCKCFDDEPAEANSSRCRSEDTQTAVLPSTEGMPDANTKATPNSLAPPDRFREQSHVTRSTRSDKGVTKVIQMANYAISEQSFGSSSYSSYGSGSGLSPPTMLRTIAGVWKRVFEQIKKDKAERLEREEDERLEEEEEERSWIHQKAAMMKQLNEEESRWLVKRS